MSEVKYRSIHYRDVWLICRVCNGQTGESDLGRIMVRLVPNGTNRGLFFRSDFSTFWLTEPKCTEIRSENVPDMSKYGPIWPTPEPNLISLSSDGLVLAYYKKIWMLICALIWIIQIILKLRTITYSKYFYYWIKKPGVIFVPLLTDTLL